MKMPNKRSIVSLNIIAVLGTVLIMVLVGVIIVNTITEVPPYPEGPFKILGKQIGHGSVWFIPTDFYYFQYANNSRALVEVSQEIYGQYNIGDMYPNNIVIWR
jgi:hypothetical protein